MATLNKQFRIMLMIAASLLCLGAFIILNDLSYRQETNYRDLQLECYRLATDWHRSVGTIRGLIYVFEPLPKAMETARRLLGEVISDMDNLKTINASVDPLVQKSVMELTSSIRAGMQLSQDILAAGDIFISQEDLPPGLLDGKISMFSFLGRDVSRSLSPRSEYNYFQLTRKLKEMNAFFDDLYVSRLNRLLDTIISQTGTIRLNFFVLRLGLLGITVAVIAMLVWQLVGLNRFLRQLARRTGEELVTTRLNLSEANTHLQSARFQQSLFDMVTGVSHELNTPLGNCITVSSFLESNMQALSQKTEDNLFDRKELSIFLQQNLSGFELLRGNLGRMKAQIDTFKQLAAANHGAHQQSIMASRYLEDRIGYLSERHANQLEIVTHLKAEDDFLVSAENLDPIFAELLQNSMDHGQATLVDIEFLRKPDGVTIRFSDNGKGVSKQDLERLAEPFFTTARGQKHMGLGLSIVMSVVVNKLNGSLSFDHGQPGLVTTMVFPLASS